ncbi:uncharacterized protein LOC107038077 isoform X2 [Diachasma alloeum]|uniref:uncharacterized protein LOC107038077 isoform X2 n=1 Tax=Diachasma alloeum TaxID=454923 RepID=UPI0007381E04|nr:uncharacterized protein LOC107038077 isoform X2 [Diachasma alloeum]
MSNNGQESETTISDLPDECLRQIFLNVPMSTIPGKSWISLRAVCTRWTEIIDDCWREFKRLLLYDGAAKLTLISSPETLLAVTSNESLNRRTAHELIEYCGPHLRVLMEHRKLLSTPSIMALAAKECPNLCEFSGFLMTKTDAIQLRELLDACKYMKNLKVHILAEQLYSFFQGIPTHQLEQLSIFASSIADRNLPKYIKATIRHCQVLQGLFIDYVDDELVELLTNLRQLCLGRPDFTMIDRYRPLPLIHDKFLVSMSKKCLQLETIKLQHCINVTDQGISVLSALPNLKVLHLLCLPGVTGKYLKKFVNIKELNLVGCPASDVEVTGILKNCHVLQTLDVICTKITDKTLEVAVKVTKKRTNNITLKIHCYHTMAHPEIFEGASPLLKTVR